MNKLVEKAGLCALNRIFGFEPKIGLQLMEMLGSAQKVFALSKEEMEVHRVSKTVDLRVLEVIILMAIMMERKLLKML